MSWRGWCSNPDEHRRAGEDASRLHRDYTSEHRDMMRERRFDDCAAQYARGYEAAEERRREERREEERAEERAEDRRAAERRAERVREEEDYLYAQNAPEAEREPTDGAAP